MGIPINEVIDIGVQNITEPLVYCFPDKKHILFEPIEEWHSHIELNYKKINYVLHKLALSNNDGESFLETSSVNKFPITHARLNSNPKNTNRCRKIITKKLDTIMENSLSGPYLLKIDVDGAEIDILEGSVKTLEFCSVVVIEAHPRDFLERSEFFVSRNFVLLDVVDLCYYEGIMRQFDMIFANNKYLQGYWGPDFDVKKWYNYNP